MLPGRYEHLLHTEVALSLGGSWEIRHTVQHWVNDGLMALFVMVVGLVGGIVFTMSIFIADLGFAGQPENLLMAKTGVLFASVLAGVSGYLWLRLAAGRN